MLETSYYAYLKLETKKLENKNTTRSKDNKAYIREISSLYAVGQTQPLTEVPAPNSRSANNFVKNRLQVNPPPLLWVMHSFIHDQHLIILQSGIYL